MKKTYINPATKVVKIELQKFIAASQLGIGTAGSANNAEARRSYYWDDEDEDFDY